MLAIGGVAGWGWAMIIPPIGPPQLSLSVTAGKRLTLTATDNYTLTVPASLTAAGQNYANIFTETQTIQSDTQALWYMRTANDAGNPNQILAYKARGTLSSPTVTVSGSQQLLIRGFSYTGAAYEETNQIEFLGWHATQPDAGSIVFKTKPSGGVLTDRLALLDDGTVRINGYDITTDATLFVNGSAHFYGASSAVVMDTTLKVLTDFGVGADPSASRRVTIYQTSPTRVSTVQIQGIYAPTQIMNAVFPTQLTVDGQYGSAYTATSSLFISHYVSSKITGAGVIPIRGVDIFSQNAGAGTAASIVDLNIRTGSNTGGGAITAKIALNIETQTIAGTNHAIKTGAGGLIQFGVLAGTGTRAVVVDANGVLSAP